MTDEAMKQTHMQTYFSWIDKYIYIYIVDYSSIPTYI